MGDIYCDDKMSFRNYSRSDEIMETENEALNAAVRRGKYRSNLPLPRGTGTNISKFGYQETPKSALQLPIIDQSLSERKMYLSSIDIGERVCVSGTKLGVLRFYGNTSFAGGWWCGIELDEAIGKNSGEIDGVTYFTCRENHGIFAPPSKVELLTNVGANLERGDCNSEEGNTKNLSESAEKVIKSKLMAPKVYPKCLPPVKRSPNASYVIQDANSTRVLDLGGDATFDKSPEVTTKQNVTFEKVAEDRPYVLPVIQDGFASKSMSEESRDAGNDGDDDSKMAEEAGDFVLNDAKIDKDDFESFDCDDSLGILTPSQMMDSMFGDSLLKTPSFEDVLELTDEMADFEAPSDVGPEKIVAATSTPVTYDKESAVKMLPDIWSELTPKVRANDSLFSMFANKPGISSEPTPNMRANDSYFYSSQFANTPEVAAKPEVVNPSPITASRNRAELKRGLDGGDGNASRDSLQLSLALSESPHHVTGASLDGLALMEKMGNNFCEALDKKDRPMSSLTMSVTSIDTGYQGDAEGDVHSGAPSAANTPIEEQKFGVDEKDLLLMISCDGHNFLRHPRTDVGSDSDFCSDMGTSWTESEVENEEKGRGRAARVIDGTLYYNDVNNEVNNNHVTCNIVIPRPKEEVAGARSSDSSTLDETLTEKLAASDEVPEVGCVVAPGGVRDATLTIEGDAMECRGDEAKDSTPDKKKKSSGARNRKRNELETPTKKFKSPKKNVMSKIKAMIEATTCKSAGDEDGGGAGTGDVETAKRVARTPRKNSRWEAVMSKIAAGQAEEKAKGKAKKEVRSRVNTNLAAAKAKSTCERTTRDSTLSELSENVSEVGDNLQSNRSSRSDVSSGKRKPRNSRITSTERALSPSQLSDISTMSAASHLSSLSRTSHHNTSASLFKKNRKGSRVTNQLEKELNLSDRPKSNISAAVLKTNRRNVANLPLKKPPSGVLAAKTAQSSLANGGSSRTTIASPKTPTLAPKRANFANQSRSANASRVSLPQQRSNKSVPAATQGAKAEQNRVRNLKTAPVVKSGHHQPDLLNLSSVNTSENEEIKRLETLCEAHTKEIGRLSCLLQQRTLGFEALTVCAKYYVDDLDALAHPSMMREMSQLRRSLGVCKLDLDRVILEKSDLVVEHHSELDKLKRGHENDVATLKEMIVKNFEDEIQKLKDEFTETRMILIEKHEAEVLECREMDEQLFKEKWNDQLQDFRSQHSLQINTIETEYDLKVEELTKEFNGINYNLEQQLQAMVSKCSDLNRQKREYEDALLKDNNSKLQIVAGTISDLQKEIESLKAVIELRNCEIHELRAVSNKVATLEEELYLSEEKIKLLSTKTEDLQAQVDLKNSKERQLSNEQQLLKGWFEKEAKQNKRLSMENEQLQWKLAKSMEAASLTALFENSQDQMNEIPNAFMTTSTPLLRGASDGEAHKSPSSKRSLPFNSNKTIPSPRCSLVNRDERARHHRQRFSISENNDAMTVRDVSPASRYRRAQSLSWTVGLHDFNAELAASEEPNDVHYSTSNEEQNTENTLTGNGKLNGEPEKTVAEPEEKEFISEKAAATATATAASQVVIKRACLERRNSISPDARVPSLIQVQYGHEQSSARAKRERRNSLGNLKHAEEAAFTSRSCRSLSTPYDFQAKKKSPRNSPVKTKTEMAARLKAMEQDGGKMEEEEAKMEESQESVNVRSMTDSEDFSAPLTVSLNSCDSSPPPEPNDLIDQSSRSEDSSPRASPQFRSSMQEESIGLYTMSPRMTEGESLGVYTMSPRMSAGESMIMDDVPKQSRSEEMAASDLILRRTFPEYYAAAKESSSSFEDNQGTPESSSVGVLPTDSTNIDLSWSEDEDEIPSESEV